MFWKKYIPKAYLNSSSWDIQTTRQVVVSINHLMNGNDVYRHQLHPVAKISIPTGHAMQIYNCLGQL